MSNSVAEITSAPSKQSSVFNKLIDPSGCVIEQITTADYDEYQVQGVSADGKILAMTASLDGPAKTGNDSVYQVYEMDLNTGKKTPLSKSITNSGPFSPDGKFIVVAQKTDNEKTDIFEYERATGKLRVVAPHEQWDWLPSYSPDGQLILFNSYRVDGQSDIHLLEKSTGNLRRITDYPDYDAHAQFSADGKRIVFNRQRGNREDGGYIFDLIVYDIETAEEMRVTDSDYEEGYPAWAPDGRHIVYSSDINNEPKKPNLYVLAPDGGNSTRLTKGNWKDSYAFWTVDGHYIYFNSDRLGNSDIFRMPMKGLSCVREAS